MLTDRDFISYAAYGDTYRWQLDRMKAPLYRDLIAFGVLVIIIVVILSIMG